MKKRLAFFPIVLSFYSNQLLAQNFRILSLNFKPMFGNSVLQLNDSVYKLNKNDSIQFEILKFYISGIEFWKNSVPVWIEPISFHLIDASDINTLKLILNIPNDIFFTEIKFKLGIDSITNVSGAMGGDLDPTKGMYWTWQSGYINFKLEGKSNLCQTKNNEFHLHLGGYAYPFSTLQSISLVTSNTKNISINFDLKTFLNEIDLTNNTSIMSPKKEAVKLSNQLGQLFKIEE